MFILQFDLENICIFQETQDEDIVLWLEEIQETVLEANRDEEETIKSIKYFLLNLNFKHLIPSKINFFYTLLENNYLQFQDLLLNYENVALLDQNV